MHLRQRHPTAIRTWGERAPWPARAGSLLSSSPLVPHQEAVRQHDGHRMAAEARPQSALILVPAQQPLGLLMILLHPVPPMGVFHQPLQRHVLPEIAPVVPSLAIGGVLADQPARFAPPRRRHPPDPQGDELPAHPASAPLPPPASPAGRELPRPPTPAPPPPRPPPATPGPFAPRSPHRPAGSPRPAGSGSRRSRSGRRPHSAAGAPPARPRSWGYHRSRR